MRRQDALVVPLVTHEKGALCFRQVWGRGGGYGKDMDRDTHCDKPGGTSATKEFKKYGRAAGGGVKFAKSRHVSKGASLHDTVLVATTPILEGNGLNMKLISPRGDTH